MVCKSDLYIFFPIPDQIIKSVLRLSSIPIKLHIGCWTTLKSGLPQLATGEHRSVLPPGGI